MAHGGSMKGPWAYNHLACFGCAKAIWTFPHGKVAPESVIPITSSADHARQFHGCGLPIAANWTAPLT